MHHACDKLTVFFRFSSPNDRMIAFMQSAHMSLLERKYCMNVAYILFHKKFNNHVY